MAFQEIPSFDLLLIARTLLVSGEATYLAHIVELETTWAELSGMCARGGAPFPFRFSNKEGADIEADVNRAMRDMEAMRGVKESIGELLPERGIVRNDLYDEALNALQQMKEQVIDTYARDEKEKEIWREGWPSDN